MSYSTIAWQGIMPAVTTKFTPEDQIDLEACAANTEAQINAGVSGIVLGGTLGEASTLTAKEKKILTESTVDVVGGRVPVLLNIAEQSTKDAVAAAHAAENYGANALMLLPPMRYKATSRETVAYLKEVALATDLPIMIYNNPVDYKIEVTITMFEELLEIETIQAVKESTRDISNVTRLRNAFGDRIKIMTGVDTLGLESLLMGADGWIAGLVCAFPEETVAIYELVKAGRIGEARELYRWFLPLLELDIHPQLVQHIKLAETAVGLGSSYVRPPRLELEGDELEKVQQIIDRGIASRPDLNQLKPYHLKAQIPN